ncbi:MAG: hypothetical protein WD424_11150 [Paenibacillaceae bacterium]
MDDFKTADLTNSQLESVIAMERDLQVSTGNEIVLVAYEHVSNDGDVLMKPEKNN